MATQVSLNDGAVASAGALAIQTNGTTQAVSISTGQVATLAQNPILTSGTANGVAYLNGSKAVTSGSALVFDGTNLGIGTTSPTAKLQVFKGASGSGAIADSALALQYDATTTYGRHFMDGNGFYQIYAPSGGVSGGNLSLWATTSVQFRTAGAAADPAKMTLDASGNLGIGTTSPLSIFNIKTSNGQFLVQNGTSSAQMRISAFNNAGDANAALIFEGYSSEYGRFDSSGNLLVGTTSSAQGSGVGNKFLGTGAVYVVNAATSDAFSYYNSSASAYRFYVSSGGTISATNTTISAISDQRFKENIQDLDAGLDKIMALKPRKFDWKEGKGANIKNARGFIAQEFEEVFPDLIDEWKDPAPEGEEPYKAVRADLIPVLVKAIQEQQALITQLTARITALEGA